jgi:hypothetical protein
MRFFFDFLEQVRALYVYVYVVSQPLPLLSTSSLFLESNHVAITSTFYTPYSSSPCFNRHCCHVSATRSLSSHLSIRHHLSLLLRHALVYTMVMYALSNVIRVFSTALGPE